MPVRCVNAGSSLGLSAGGAQTAGIGALSVGIFAAALARLVGDLLGQLADTTRVAADRLGGLTDSITAWCGRGLAMLPSIRASSLRAESDDDAPCGRCAQPLATVTAREKIDASIESDFMGGLFMARSCIALVFLGKGG